MFFPRIGAREVHSKSGPRRRGGWKVWTPAGLSQRFECPASLFQPGGRAVKVSIEVSESVTGRAGGATAAGSRENLSELGDSWLRASGCPD